MREQIHCKPHRFRIPEPGDANLICGRCGHIVSMEKMLSTYPRFGVIKAYGRLHGKAEAEVFTRKLAAALNYHLERRERWKSTKVG